MVTKGCTIQIRVSHPEDSGQTDLQPSIVVQIRPQGKSDYVDVEPSFFQKFKKLTN